DAMDVGDPGYGRLLLEVVVQIEAEADAHEDPEHAEPDQRSPAIFARRPGRGCMDVHPLFPPSPSEKRTTMGLMRWVHSCIEWWCTAPETNRLRSSHQEASFRNN